MPLFTPITTFDGLPKENEDYETFVMDLKARLDGDVFEHAKDIASFANHLGGSIIVGFGEDKKRGLAGKRMPLTDAEAKTAAEAYSNALRDLCQPRPVMTPDKVAVPGGTVLVINVWPYPAQVVGVRLPAKEGESRPNEVYAFPMRASTETTFLEPEHVHMFMSPEIRRTIILLNAIPPNAKIGIIEQSHATYHARSLQVDEARNVLIADGTKVVCLDYIRTVFEESKGAWRIMVVPNHGLG